MHSTFEIKSPVHCSYSEDMAINSDLNILFCTGMKFRQLTHLVLGILRFLSQPRLTLFSTTTLARGGWLNSALLFSSWAPDLLKILLALFACLLSASLNLLVISILNLTSSFLWWLILQKQAVNRRLCLESALQYLLYVPKKYAIKNFKAILKIKIIIGCPLYIERC